MLCVLLVSINAHVCLLPESTDSDQPNQADHSGDSSGSCAYAGASASPGQLSS